MILKETLNTSFEKNVTISAFTKDLKCNIIKAKPGTLILKTLPVHYYSNQKREVV